MKVLHTALAFWTVLALSAFAGVRADLTPSIGDTSLPTSSSVIESASGKREVIGEGETAASSGVQTPTLTASFSLSSERVLTGAPVTLDATSSDGDIVEYAWDLDGDGAVDVTSPSPRYSVTFDRSGSYLIQLHVRNALGATADSDVAAIEIANQSPVAIFLAPDPSTDVSAVSFQDASRDADGRIATWRWDFGDGTTSALASPIHSYAEPGVYTISLTVTDNEGAASATYVKPITVDNASPVAAFALSSSTVEPTELFTVTNESSDPSLNGRIVHVAWDFGDETYLAGGPNPTGIYTHAYSTAGTYTITLYVIDNGGALARTQHTIHVQ